MNIASIFSTLYPIAFLLMLSSFLVWLHEQQD